jgi:hypothetical protein
MIQLSGDSFLLTLAQLGLAFAAINGLILALRHRPEQRMLPREVNAIWLLIEHSFALVLLALVPFLLFHWSGASNESNVWRYSSALLAVFLVWTIYINVRRLKKGDKPRHPEQLYLFLVFTAVFLIVEVTNFFCKAFWLYGLGLVWLLCAAMWQFLISLSSYGSDAEV